MSSLRLLSLLALVACAAAAAIGQGSGDSNALALHDAHQPDDSNAREARSAGDFLKTLSSGVKGSSDQSVTYGGVYPYDRQLTSKTVYVSSTIFTVHKEVVKFSSGALIHCIQVVDLLKNGKNAAVTLQKGGINQYNAELKFKSERGGKINYLVILWGQ